MPQPPPSVAGASSSSMPLSQSSPHHTATTLSPTASSAIGNSSNNDNADNSLDDDDESCMSSYQAKWLGARHISSASIDQLELTDEIKALVSRDIIKRCVRRAKHRGNFAANLAAELFNKEERTQCNCTGTRGKRPLSPRRLNIVKEITFRVYNSTQMQAAVLSAAVVGDTASAHAAATASYAEFEDAWRKECITAIDAKNRSIGRDLIKTCSSSSSSSTSNNNNNNNSTSSGIISGNNSNSSSMEKATKELMISSGGNNINNESNMSHSNIHSPYSNSNSN